MVNVIVSKSLRLHLFEIVESWFDLIFKSIDPISQFCERRRTLTLNEMNAK